MVQVVLGQVSPCESKWGGGGGGWWGGSTIITAESKLIWLHLPWLMKCFREIYQSG